MSEGDRTNAFGRLEATSKRALTETPRPIDTVEETAQKFPNIAWQTQEQAMDEPGDVDPKTSC